MSSAGNDTLLSKCVDYPHSQTQTFNSTQQSTQLITESETQSQKVKVKVTLESVTLCLSQSVSE